MAYRKLSFYPTLDQAAKLSALPFENGKLYTLAEVRSFHDYLLHPKWFVKDYMGTLWKEGFIKQVLPFVRDPYRIDMAIKKAVRILRVKRC